MRYLLMLICIIPAMHLQAEQADKPVLTWSLPNIERTRERLSTSIFGDLWRHPSLAQLTQKFDQAMAEDIWQKMV